MARGRHTGPRDWRMAAWLAALLAAALVTGSGVVLAVSTGRPVLIAEASAACLLVLAVALL